MDNLKRIVYHAASLVGRMNKERIPPTRNQDGVENLLLEQPYPVMISQVILLRPSLKKVPQTQKVSPEINRKQLDKDGLGKNLYKS